MKKNIRNKFYMALSASVLFMSACGKDSSTSTKTKSDYIATSTWKYSEAGIDLDGNGTIDQPAPASLVMACLTDNTITFKADKTGTIDEGATKCDASTAQVSPFTWSVTATDSLVLSTALLTGFGNSAKIREVTDTKFVLSNTISPTGFPLPIVVVLVH